MALLTSRAGNTRTDGAWRRRVASFVGLLLLCFAVPNAAAQPETSEEYQLKAAILYKLTQFVEWPAAAFRETDTPLVVGILGDDPFGAYLDELMKGEKLGTHPLIVRRFRRGEDIAECHMLFVSRSETGVLDKALAQLKGRSVLTVSDADLFAQRGGMMRLVMEKKKIRFDINQVAAKAADLTISSKILTLATIVTPAKP